MKCPACGFADSKVIDSRHVEEGNSIRRRRECLACQKRYTTFEIVETVQIIVTKKNGKYYFHFYDGVRSSSVALQYFPNMPKSVRLLNTGKPLKASFDLLPEYFSNGQAQPFLHVTGIPVDDLANEAIVIEIDW